MCGRYTLHQKMKALAKRFSALDYEDDDVFDNYNVAPGQHMPVVIESNDGRPKLEVMKWGLVPRWAKDPKIGYKLINARDDTIFDKPMWRSVILKKRCLIPADGFYEWKKPPADSKEQKQPFYIRPKHEQVFSFAGVWESWKDAEGLEWHTYSIITTEPNQEMSSVHNRMPVILHKEDEAAWLDPKHNGDRGAIESLLHPYEDNGLEMYAVSRDVNVTQNNDAKLIYPINSQ